MCSYKIVLIKKRVYILVIPCLKEPTPSNICWSSRRLQRNNFTSSKTSWRRRGRRKIVTLKTSWRHLEDVLKTSWRETKCFLGISVSDKSKCVSNKSLFHKSISDKAKANPKCVTWNPTILIFVLFWNTSSISILRIKISEIGEWASEAIKTRF